jgi:hypothetical protein
MTAVVCLNAADRKAETWAEQVAAFDRLEFAVSDAAKGIAAAVGQVAEARRDGPKAPPLGHGLDVFHTAMEANGVPAVLAACRGGVGAGGGRRPEGRRRETAGPRRAGRGPDRPRRVGKAIAALEQVQRLESAWDRVHAALGLFGPDGRLNDRARATAAALRDLTGPDRSKVRNSTQRPAGPGLPGPDAPPAGAGRAAAGVARGDSLEVVAAAPPGAALGPGHGVWIRAVGRGRALSAEEHAPYARVAAVLGDTFRASSAVECLNSVLRMQQSRHRRMTQPMLDLKRLYWNTRPLRPPQGRLPVPAAGPGAAHVRLLGVASHRPGPVDATTVNSRECRVRQAPDRPRKARRMDKPVDECQNGRPC